MKRAIALSAAAFVIAAASSSARQQPSTPSTPSQAAPAATISRGAFSFAYDERGISLLKNPDDPFGATVTTPPAGGRGGRAGAAPQTPPRAATLTLALSYKLSGATA